MAPAIPTLFRARAFLSALVLSPWPMPTIQSPATARTKKAALLQKPSPSSNAVPMPSLTGRSSRSSFVPCASFQTPSLKSPPPPRATLSSSTCPSCYHFYFPIRQSVQSGLNLVTVHVRARKGRNRSCGELLVPGSTKAEVHPGVLASEISAVRSPALFSGEEIHELPQTPTAVASVRVHRRPAASRLAPFHCGVQETSLPRRRMGRKRRTRYGCQNELQGYGLKYRGHGNAGSFRHGRNGLAL